MNILVQTAIIFECNQIFRWILQNMWSESSSVSTVNLAKKIYYHSRYIEFFLGVPFLWRALVCIFPPNFVVGHATPDKLIRTRPIRSVSNHCNSSKKRAIQNIHHLWDWIEQCFTSPPIQYRLYGRRFYRSKDPTNSITKCWRKSYKGKPRQCKQQNTHTNTKQYTLKRHTYNTQVPSLH